MRIRKERKELGSCPMVPERVVATRGVRHQGRVVCEADARGHPRKIVGRVGTEVDAIAIGVGSGRDRAGDRDGHEGGMCSARKQGSDEQNDGQPRSICASRDGPGSRGVVSRNEHVETPVGLVCPAAYC